MIEDLQYQCKHAEAEPHKRLLHSNLNFLIKLHNAASSQAKFNRQIQIYQRPNSNYNLNSRNSYHPVPNRSTGPTVHNMNRICNVNDYMNPQNSYQPNSYHQQISYPPANYRRPTNKLLNNHPAYANLNYRTYRNENNNMITDYNRTNGDSMDPNYCLFNLETKKERNHRLSAADTSTNDDQEMIQDDSKCNSVSEDDGQSEEQNQADDNATQDLVENLVGQNTNQNVAVDQTLSQTVDENMNQNLVRNIEDNLDQRTSSQTKNQPDNQICVYTEKMQQNDENAFDGLTCNSLELSDDQELMNRLSKDDYQEMQKTTLMYSNNVYSTDPISNQTNANDLHNYQSSPLQHRNASYYSNGNNNYHPPAVPQTTYQTGQHIYQSNPYQHHSFTHPNSYPTPYTYHQANYPPNTYQNRNYQPYSHPTYSTRNYQASTVPHHENYRIRPNCSNHYPSTNHWQTSSSNCYQSPVYNPKSQNYQSYDS